MALPVRVRPHARHRLLIAAAALTLLVAAAPALGANGADTLVERLVARYPAFDRPGVRKVLEQVVDPWFIFGMFAQFVFFMRFVVQWIASERKKRSTVPVSFWYLSLAGSLAIFVYSVHRFDLVFMAAQLLACVIYVRNLMLISAHRKRRLQAGLPPEDTDEWESDEPQNRAAGQASGH